jgi:hypothetical protein
MLKRILLLFTVLLTAFCLTASSQEIQLSGFVLFEDGERVEISDDPYALETIMMQFLDSPKNGRCEIFENGQQSLLVLKTGEQVQVTFQGQTETMTVADVKQNFSSAKAEGQLTACKSNLHNIATALEMFASDQNGSYPASLAELIPNYLRMVPTCPASGTDTYSSTYKQFPGPVFFRVQCNGGAHPGYPAGTPAYDGEQGFGEEGLLESPDGLDKSSDPR